jgi:hypothetical protein
MNRYKLFFAGVGCVLWMVLAAESRSPAPQPFSLLVVPERVNLVQAAFDVIARRPVALVAYRPAREEGASLVLHGWTGNAWVPVSLENYEGGHFLIKQPDRIILVGNDASLPLDLLVASGWGPLVMTIDTLETADFLNSIGQLYGFTASEFRWFAARYGMEIEDVTPATARVSWYDQMTEVRKQMPQQPLPERLDPVPVLDEPTAALRPAPPPPPVQAPRPVPPETVDPAAPVATAEPVAPAVRILERRERAEPVPAAPVEDEQDYIK